MFSVQGKGAEGCKELLEAFEACVKGATAASWGGHDVTCKYFNYFLILLCFSSTFICFFCSYLSLSIYLVYFITKVLWNDSMDIYLLSGRMHWFVHSDFLLLFLSKVLPFWVLQCPCIPSHCTGLNHFKDSERGASPGKQWSRCPSCCPCYL